MSRHRLVTRAASLCLVLLAATLPALAGAPLQDTSTRAFQPGEPLDMLLYDRTAGRTLPLYVHRGDLYVAGEPGHEYEIRLRNPGDARVLAVASVDGVNVVTGRTAAVDQPGYVVDAWGSACIDGWRKSLGEVARFFFTTPRNSYAARTGRPDEIGVIGMAMFREATRPEAREREAPAAAASADSAAAGASQRRDSGPAETVAVEPGLGTGHGARHDSPVVHTAFERSGRTPDAIVRIYYDSYRRLVARGVIEPEPRLARRRPEAFPGGFVPDP